MAEALPASVPADHAQTVGEGFHVAPVAPPVRTERVRVSGIDVDVRISGEGAPLLLLSGIFGELPLWRPLLPYLEGFQSIAFDPPGVGRTKAAAAPMSMVGLANFTIGVLDALGIESAHVLGASFGYVERTELSLYAISAGGDGRRLDRDAGQLGVAVVGDRVVGGGRDQDQVSLADLLGVAGDGHRAGSAHDHVDLLGLFVGTQGLFGSGRDREPGDGEIAGTEFARVHQSVGAQPVPLLYWCVLETPDEHRRALYQNRASRGYAAAT